ncbi:MAG: APC family permease [Gemmataceae bacterium]|nr:APC family permease [Gemmataceae bacterium]
MSTPSTPSGPTGGASGSTPRPPSTSTSQLLRTTQVIVVGSVMLSFISFWKTAAVVLCDLASTAYYIGGIAESAIGKAAPWFILSVMVFSYTVRSVYIESCSMFVRGGVYRVVREAMGGFMGKLAVSALLFDYILTGPISSVTAGQYIVSLGFEILERLQVHVDPAMIEHFKSYGSMAFAVLVTLYFYRQNVVGIHESADKAFKIMIATSVMAVLMIVWCGITFALNPEKARLPGLEIDLNPKVVIEDVGGQPVVKMDAQTGKPVPRVNPVTGQQFDPLGFLPHILPPDSVAYLRQHQSWFGFAGLFAILVAFGHSILAMSGEETLAQVYREVESPKLPNFRKAALVVFVYSLALTSLISFFAVMLIPDAARVGKYSDNLIGGLAMNVAGPDIAKLLLNGFVVVVGSLILSGAVNTAIIGSNGVLNRVAEDGVVPVWLQKPHPKYGTSYRILRVILALKLFTILVSRGDVLVLGEAYAFGVVWSFVFMSLAMVILRFRQPNLNREYRVPLNLKLGSVEIPFGLIFVFLVLFMAAVVNLFTKEVATVAGLIFTFSFLAIFTLTERLQGKPHTGGKSQHLEQFNVQSSEEVNAESLGLRKPYTKLVAIRSPYNLFMLEKALAETDPETTSVVVMTAKVLPTGDVSVSTDLDQYDQALMTAVVDRAEKAGKRVKPLIVPTNNAMHAVLRLAHELKAQEVILGASNKYPADVQMETIQLYWMNLQSGESSPLTVRLLSKDRDLYLDIDGGNRIPKISERQAKSVAELRAAGVGYDRVLLVDDGSRAGSDLFHGVLTLLDPQVALAVAHIPASSDVSTALLEKDVERARALDREVSVQVCRAEQELIELAAETGIDVIIAPRAVATESLFKDAPCTVFMAVPPEIPDEVAKD